MLRLPSLPRLVPLLALASVTVLACEPAPMPSAPEAVADAVPATMLAQAGNAEVGNWLARLRANLAEYHRFEIAADGDYDTDLTGCMESGEGGMGHHYADLGLLDDVIEDTRPEALLYEPQKNGRMRLVAVEYIVPFSEVWPEVGPAPTLHGQTYSANEVFGVWALHAWVWRHNPSGMFAGWNPTVTCDYAD